MAAPQIPIWLRGRNTTQVSITPVTVDAAGAMTDGSAQSLLGQIDEINIENTQESEEVSALDTTLTHQLLIKDTWTITLIEILKKRNPQGGAVTTPTSYLMQAAAAGDYFRVLVARGNIAGTNAAGLLTANTGTYSFYGLRGRYSEQIRRGKSTASLELVMQDPGQVNPSVTP